MAYIRMGRPIARPRGTNVVPGGFGRGGALRFSLSVRPLLLSALDKLSAPNGDDEHGKPAATVTDASVSSEAA